jgi:hypothetical protein
MSEAQVSCEQIEGQKAAEITEYPDCLLAALTEPIELWLPLGGMAANGPFWGATLMTKHFHATLTCGEVCGVIAVKLFTRKASSTDPWRSVKLTEEEKQQLYDYSGRFLKP